MAFVDDAAAKIGLVLPRRVQESGGAVRVYTRLAGTSVWLPEDLIRRAGVPVSRADLFRQLLLFAASRRRVAELLHDEGQNIISLHL